MRQAKSSSFFANAKNSDKVLIQQLGKAADRLIYQQV